MFSSDRNTLVIVVGFFLVILAAFLYLRGSKTPRTRGTRKRAKIAWPLSIVKVTPGVPRNSGRPMMVDIDNAVANLNRRTPGTINSALRRQDFNQSSERLVRSVLRRLTKKGTLVRQPMFPNAPVHQPALYYASAR